MNNEIPSSDECEELIQLVDFVNEMKDFSTPQELQSLEDSFPTFFGIDEDGRLETALPHEPEKVSQNPYPAPALQILEPQIPTIIEQPETPIMSPGRSLDGRLLNILPREQRLLQAIRSGASTAILETLYITQPANRRRHQVDQDAQHIGELLQLHGYTLELVVRDGKSYYEERRREPKPRTSTDATPHKATLVKPLTSSPASPTTKTQSSAPERRIFNPDTLSPSDQIAYEALRESSFQSPLKASTLLNRINEKRVSIGARILSISEIEGVINVLLDAGMQIGSLTTKNGTLFYRK